MGRWETVLPNPKLKLMDQVREVMRVKHYAIRTEQCYCDWIRRYVHFHNMQSRADLGDAESKIELFLSDLAVNGQVAASTQNQAFNALRLRVQDLDFGMKQITVRDGKGAKDRFTVLAEGAIPGMKSPLDCL